MPKTVTTFRDDLRSMSVGSSLEYKRKSHKGYLATASYLKAKGEGIWECRCSMFDRIGLVTRVS